MAPLVAFSFTSTINLCIHRGIPGQELIVHVMCKIFQVHGTDNTKQKVKICDAMSRDDVERQYLRAMKCIWEAVDKLWKPADVLTPLGHHFCQMWAVRAAHPEFPYALHMLTCMCALVNGVWPFSLLVPALWWHSRSMWIIARHAKAPWLRMQTKSHKS